MLDRRYYEHLPPESLHWGTWERHTHRTELKHICFNKKNTHAYTLNVHARTLPSRLCRTRGHRTCPLGPQRLRWSRDRFHTAGGTEQISHMISNFYFYFLISVDKITSLWHVIWHPHTQRRNAIAEPVQDVLSLINSVLLRPQIAGLLYFSHIRLSGISSTAQTAFILFCKCSTSQVKHSENLTENLNVDFQADFLKTDSKPEANVYMEWQRITADGLDPLFSRIRH